MAKKVNEELNLSPFIDLFSTLVVFLILTAVWNQLSSLSTNIESSTSSDSPPPPKKQVELAVTLLPTEVQMMEDKNIRKIANRGKELNMEEITRILIEWKRKYPKKNDVVLNTQNSIPYGNMIRVFDTMVGAEFPDVGVNTQ